MKKFIVKDELGEQYQVEEIAEETPAAQVTAEAAEAADPDPVDQVHDEGEESLTPEEIAALKKLAGMADQLVNLISVENAEHAATAESAEDADDPIENDEDDEEIIDTDLEEMIANKTAHDSKKSLGSLENKTKTNDSADQHELDIAAAWAKRYGG